MISAGRLEHRLAFYEPKERKDDFGAAKIVYVKTLCLWAQITTQNGRDMVASNQDVATAPLHVVMRYTNKIMNSWRFSWDGQFYEIAAIVNNKRNDMTSLNARWTQGVITIEDLIP